MSIYIYIYIFFLSLTWVSGLACAHLDYILNIDIMLIFINTYQIQYNVVNLLSEFKTRQNIFLIFKKKKHF